MHVKYLWHIYHALHHSGEKKYTQSCADLEFFFPGRGIYVCHMVVRGVKNLNFPPPPPTQPPTPFRSAHDLDKSVSIYMYIKEIKISSL